MALSTIDDLIGFATATTGTGAITPGTATAGCRGSSALVSGQTYSYAIRDGNNYEDGQAVWNGATLSRAVNISSNANAAISLSGAATVVITALAADFPDMGRLFLAGRLLNADFNSTADQAITLTAPTNAAGISLWAMFAIIISNPNNGSGGALSMTTARGAFYAAASKTTPISNGTITSTFVALKTATDVVSYAPGGGFGLFPASSIPTAGAADNLYFTSATATIYLSLTTPQGASAKADIRVLALRLM